MTFCFNSISDNVYNNQILFVLERLRTNVRGYKAIREKFVLFTDVSKYVKSAKHKNGAQGILME